MRTTSLEPHLVTQQNFPFSLHIAINSFVFLAAFTCYHARHKSSLYLYVYSNSLVRQNGNNFYRHQKQVALNLFKDCKNMITSTKIRKPRKNYILMWQTAFNLCLAKHYNFKRFVAMIFLFASIRDFILIISFFFLFKSHVGSLYIFVLWKRVFNTLPSYLICYITKTNQNNKTSCSQANKVIWNVIFCSIYLLVPWWCTKGRP